MARGMLQHLDELFYLVPTKIKYCYGEYQKEFGELPSNVLGKLSEGFKVSYFEWNIIHISKFKPGTVEKNSSTIGPPAGIKPMPLRCRCNAL